MRISKNLFFENVKAILPTYFDEPVEVEIKFINKGSYSYNGCLVHHKSDDDVVLLAAANLDEIYETYDDFDKKAYDEIYRMVTSKPEGVDVNELKKNILDYDWIKDHLFLRLVNEFSVPKNAIARPFADNLVLIPYVRVDKNTCFCVTTDLYDKAEDEIFEDAFRKAPTTIPAYINTMYDELGMPEIDDLPMVVLSNSDRVHGAAAIAYPGIAATISREYFEGGDFRILTSSIHELIAIGVKEDGEVMRAMVRAINEEFVTEKDWLSDSIYYYNAETDTVTLDV